MGVEGSGCRFQNPTRKSRHSHLMLRLVQASRPRELQIAFTLNRRSQEHRRVSDRQASFDPPGLLPAQVKYGKLHTTA